LTLREVSALRSLALTASPDFTFEGSAPAALRGYRHNVDTEQTPPDCPHCGKPMDRAAKRLMKTVWPGLRLGDAISYEVWLCPTCRRTRPLEKPQT
jgi:hypothetical protein